ncbi:DUF3501 family protein [Tuwongella immobilis]|uniref:DUF3501 domain-containing protein n=1 Tax=Tuwongella immobilis TaxID=692036 RepID=A0A6C2YP85_9BACT|nr:DUF3501 family protein [Tuwongella immobilis]VIP03438.1 Uncharacterized protein OS=uncultured bacterium FPPP_13C3 PE=4 SV=1: DUF3501 [Tuwongella immobilis]VTS04248.1 Uncharacterized protein OS=uncultured bacterium FPPP_13C3 PE=4 SV=1: DUF3501 [Tuwongella immobilis]
MHALTLEDLLPLEEYLPQRADFLAAHLRYLDRYRRIRVGPQVTVIFENRQTLWYRVQEMLRVTRIDQPEQIEQELNWYNQLLPRRNRLQAALLLTVPESAAMIDFLRQWRALADGALRLVIETHEIPARLVTHRNGDLSVGTAHWLEFPMNHPERQALRDARRGVFLDVAMGNYQHRSAPLSDEIRQSLYDDLSLSDRDAA